MTLLRAGTVLTNVHASRFDSYPCQAVFGSKKIWLHSQPCPCDIKVSDDFYYDLELIHLQMQVRVHISQLNKRSKFGQSQTPTS